MKSVTDGCTSRWMHQHNGQKKATTIMLSQKKVLGTIKTAMLNIYIHWLEEETVFWIDSLPFRYFLGKICLVVGRISKETRERDLKMIQEFPTDWY